jgi:CRISPR-associated protein Csm2
MSEIQTIMTADEYGKTLVAYAQNVAQPLAKTLKTTQIRKIFTEVRKIESLWFDSDRKIDAVRRLNMLKPKMAYQAKRQEKKGISPLKPLTDALTEAINAIVAVNDQEQMDIRFKRFVELFEAILAYHKAFGAEE